MSGLVAENAAPGQGSPLKRNKLSLKFFQKKDTKRALDFSEPQAEETKTPEQEDSVARWVYEANYWHKKQLFVLFGNNIPHSHVGDSTGWDADILPQINLFASIQMSI